MLNRIPSLSGIAAVSLLCLGASTLAAQSGQTNPRKRDSLAGAPVLANRVVGLVAAVVKGNDTLLMKGYGKADVEWDVPMAADAMFEVGSIAKQFTAAAIHFSEPREFEVNLFIPGVPRDSAYRHIKLDPFQFPTGQAQAYNNSAFWLLGLVVDKASGMRYEDYVASPFVGRYQHVVGGNRAFFIDVTQSPTGLAFAPNRQRAEVLPWADGLTFYANEFVTLTFRRANGDSGPVTELRRDDSGNHYILKKQ